MAGMASNQDPPVKSTAGIERHFQSFALTLITAAVLYMASFVVGAREEAAANRERLASISNQMSALQASLALMQANYVTREEWRDHEVRIRAGEAGDRKQR
jgi:predicted transcriptional regulator